MMLSEGLENLCNESLASRFRQAIYLSLGKDSAQSAVVECLPEDRFLVSVGGGPKRAMSRNGLERRIRRISREQARIYAPFNLHPRALPTGSL
jgi:RNase P protein component